MKELTLLSDPAVAAVGCDDVDEPLVCLRGLDGRLAVDEGPSGITEGCAWFCWARAGVAERLRLAARALPEGCVLVLKEAYRPLARQRASFERRVAAALAADPGLSADAARAIVAAYVAPPEVAGHPTGGAVDVTLARDGRELPMGTAYDEEPDACACRTYTDAPGLAPAEAANRALLVACMEGAGFVNYPTEWWHWSYGDRYWGLARGVSALYGPALYGPAREPIGP